MRPFLQFYTIEEAHQILVKLRSSKGGGGGGGLGCNWSIVGNASTLRVFKWKRVIVEIWKRKRYCKW